MPFHDSAPRDCRGNHAGLVPPLCERSARSLVKPGWWRVPALLFNTATVSSAPVPHRVMALFSTQQLGTLFSPRFLQVPSPCREASHPFWARSHPREGRTPPPESLGSLQPPPSSAAEPSSIPPPQQAPSLPAPSTPSHRISSHRLRNREVGLTRRCSGLATLAAELHFVRPLRASRLSTDQSQ